MIYSKVAKTAKKGLGSKLLKWFVIIITVVIILTVIVVFWSLYTEYGLNPIDPSTWDNAVILAMETEWAVVDTEQSAGGSFWSVLWRASPMGFGGAALGLGTSASGRAGMAENALKGRNAIYTFFKRLSGN